MLHSSDGKTLYTRRVVLSAVSPYFKALYTNSLKASEPEINEVNLHIPSHMLDLILDYAYAGNVTSENIEQILPITDQYEIPVVLHQCCRYLLKELQSEK